MLSHAVQGMRPNLVSSASVFPQTSVSSLTDPLLVTRQVARRWNFAFFSTPPGADGKGRTRAIQMEFETNVSRLKSKSHAPDLLVMLQS